MNYDSMKQPLPVPDNQVACGNMLNAGNCFDKQTEDTVIKINI